MYDRIMLDSRLDKNLVLYNVGITSYKILLCGYHAIFNGPVFNNGYDKI